MAMPDRASGNATAALVCGILGIFCCPITSIVAWVLGSKELKLIDAGQSSPAGRTLAQVGMIMGIVGVVLLVLQLVWLFAFGGLAIIGAMQSAGSGAVPAP